MRLIRAGNCALAAAGVGVGAYMTWVEPVYLRPALAAAATFLMCAAGNAMNDLTDIVGDRINHPERVLVTGALAPEFARRLAIACAAAAAALGALAGLEVAALVLLAAALLAAYNLHLKNLPVAGNLTVGVLGGMTFLAGGAAVDPTLAWILPGPLIPAVFAVLFHFVREILKDARDIAGDRAVGSCSLPLALGIRASLTAALVLFAALVVLTIVPVAAGWFGTLYKVITVYVIDFPVLALLILVWGNPTARMLSIGSTALKAGMALGVVALLVA